MVAIPQQKLTTHALIDSVDITEDQPRGYLGMSGLGHECERKLWYGFHFVRKQRTHSQRVERIFNTGHLAEQFMIADLKRIGCEVFRRDEDGNKHELFGLQTEPQEEAKDTTGHIAGHYDGRVIGIPEAPKTEHLLEMKTHNDKSFKEVVKKKVKAAKPMHYAQMQIYMHYAKLTRALYMAYNKNDSSYYTERVYYDESFVEDLLRKGNEIIMSEQPPTRKFSKTWFACRFCNYHDICHDGESVDKTCRTCHHGDAHNGGVWKCAMVDRELTTEQQLEGCNGHSMGWGLE